MSATVPVANKETTNDITAALKIPESVVALGRLIKQYLFPNNNEVQVAKKEIERYDVWTSVNYIGLLVCHKGLPALPKFENGTIKIVEIAEGDEIPEIDWGRISLIAQQAAFFQPYQQGHEARKVTYELFRYGILDIARSLEKLQRPAERILVIKCLNDCERVSSVGEKVIQEIQSVYTKNNLKDAKGDIVTWSSQEIVSYASALMEIVARNLGDSKKLTDLKAFEDKLREEEYTSAMPLVTQNVQVRVTNEEKALPASKEVPEVPENDQLFEVLHPHKSLMDSLTKRLEYKMQNPQPCEFRLPLDFEVMQPPPQQPYPQPHPKRTQANGPTG